MENKGVKLAEELFLNISNLRPTRVEIGIGSFLTFDFGKDVPREFKSRSGKEIINFGEWHLWVYMCAWRIDLLGNPFIASEDDRELIQSKIAVLGDQKIVGVSVLNNAFDLLMQFELGYELKLFSTNTTEDEQWLFYTPGNRVFSAGPGSKWFYGPSSDR